VDVVSVNLVLLAFFAFYGQSQWDAGRFSLRRLALLPLAIGLGMALMVNSCRAVLEALFGVKTGFVRTPKEGERATTAYRARKALGQAVVEVAFGLYLLVSCGVLVARGHLWGLWLTLVVAAGFLFLGLSTIRAHLAQRAPAPQAPPIPVETGAVRA
jgi:hypothetical protein